MLFIYPLVLSISKKQDFQHKMQCNGTTSSHLRPERAIVRGAQLSETTSKVRETRSLHMRLDSLSSALILYILLAFSHQKPSWSHSLTPASLNNRSVTLSHSQKASLPPTMLQTGQSLPHITLLPPKHLYIRLVHGDRRCATSSIHRSVSSSEGEAYAGYAGSRWKYSGS